MTGSVVNSGSFEEVVIGNPKQEESIFVWNFPTTILTKNLENAIIMEF